VIKINLGPPSARKREWTPSGVNLGIVFGGLGLLLVVGLGAWAWMLSADALTLQHEIARGKAEVDRLKPIIAEGQRYRANKEDLERRVNAIETVARDQARPAYLLDAIVDVLPADLWLTRVEEKSQILRLVGSTYSSVALADFMANLKASGKFKDVDLVESRQDLTKSPRTISFDVTCRFEI
jgi:type IV pilus assembly protein PilN